MEYAIRPSRSSPVDRALPSALRLVNITLLGRMVGVTGFWRMDTLVALVLVGATSASAIVVAHELIRRATGESRRARAAATAPGSTAAASRP